MNRNSFVQKIFNSPALIWKAGAGLMFVGLAIAIAFVPSLTDGLDKTTRYSFGGLLTVYGLFRLGTFYAEYKRMGNE